MNRSSTERQKSTTSTTSGILKQSILKVSLHKLKSDIDGTNEHGSEFKGYNVQMIQRTQVPLNSNVINWS